LPVGGGGLHFPAGGIGVPGLIPPAAGRKAQGAFDGFPPCPM
jgi:hypothetical protein